MNHVTNTRKFQEEKSTSKRQTHLKGPEQYHRPLQQRGPSKFWLTRPYRVLQLRPPFRPCELPLHALFDSFFMTSIYPQNPNRLSRNCSKIVHSNYKATEPIEFYEGWDGRSKGWFDRAKALRMMCSSPRDRDSAVM